jgi:hypothetical protein
MLGITVVYHAATNNVGSKRYALWLPVFLTNLLIFRSAVFEKDLACFQSFFENNTRT